MKQKSQIYLQVTLLGALLLLPVLIFSSVSADTESINSGFSGIWSSEQAVTTAAHIPRGADRPIVSGAPNSSTVVIAFNQKMNDAGTNFDPYMIKSTNYGATWSSPSAIHASNETSVNVYIDHDSNGKAHAVWSENNDQIFYSQENGAGGWTTPPVQINKLTVAVADTPKIFISGTTIDVVWSQMNATPPNAGVFDIYHSRCTSNCTNVGSWTSATTPIIQTSLESATPSLFVENDTIHVVWGETDLGTLENPQHIDTRYIASTDGGTTWAPKPNPPNLSDPDTDNIKADGADNGRIPQISISNDTIHVTFTEVIGNQKSTQYVHYVSCSIANSDTNCTNKDNWTPYGTVSGQVLGANDSTPYSVISSVTSLGACTFTFFHGTFDGNTTAKEQIFGTSNCGSPAWPTRTTMTANTVQSILPQMETHNNWWVYLVYNRPDGTGKNQVWLQRYQSGLYLPMIFK